MQPQHTYTLCTLVGWSFGRSVRWTRSTRLPRPSAHFLRFSSLNGAHFRRIRHQIPLLDLPHTGGTLRSLSPNLNQPENTPSEHCTARSLPALPVTVAQTRRSDDPLAISATDFITKIINISQNRTKYATTTSNFFLSLDQQRRYTQRTSTTTTGTDSHWMAGASPHQHYQARLYFLHLTLLHFSALSLSLYFRLTFVPRQLSLLLFSTQHFVYTQPPHQYHQRNALTAATLLLAHSTPLPPSAPYPSVPVAPYRSDPTELTDRRRPPPLCERECDKITVICAPVLLRSGLSCLLSRTLHFPKSPTLLKGTPVGPASFRINAERVTGTQHGTEPTTMTT